MAKKRGHGEGTIYQRSDGRWAAQVSIGIDAEGKPKRVTYYGKTRKEVQAKLDKARTEIQTGIFAEPSKGTFGAWLNRWLDVYKKPNIRPGSYANYEHVIRAHIIPSLGNIMLQALRADTLQDFYNQKVKTGRLDGTGGLAPSMIRLIHKIVSGCLKQAVKNRLITYSPAEGVLLPKMDKIEMSVLSREQVGQYLDAAKGHGLFPAFLLEMSTGLRKGELLGVRWQDIDFKAKTLNVRQTLYRVRLVKEGRSELQLGEPKTAKSKRTIPLLPSVLMELKSHKVRQAEKKLFLQEAYQDNDLVFSTALGKPICPTSLQEVHKRILKKAGLPDVRFHDLRHTFATLMVEEKEDPKVLQEMLGHSKLATTYDTYVKVSIKTMARALGALEDILIKRG